MFSKNPCPPYLQKILLEYDSLGSLQDNLYYNYFGQGELGEFRILCEKLEELGIPIIKRILFEEYVTKRIKQSLLQMNFKILKSQEEEGFFIGPRSEELHFSHPEANAFSIKRSNLKTDSMKTLPKEMIHEHATAYVLVAQKKD